MKYSRIVSYVALSFMLLLLLLSCKPKAPKGVLSQSKMEDILYDYHMAQALSAQVSADSSDFYGRLYQQSVFQKYGISSHDFDRSMQYYERHTDQLKKIYKNLTERFGGNANDESMPNNLLAQSAEKGDTMSVWRGASSILLSSQGVNRFVYIQRADTSLQAGDRLQMTYNVDWFYHEGERKIISQVVIHYDNDSVAIMQQYVYSSGSQFMSTTLGKHKVKSIECIIYQCAPWTERTRVVLLSNIKMYRLRSHEKASGDVPDSTLKVKKVLADTSRHRLLTPQLRIRDSLIKSEIENERKPHFR